MGSEEASDPAVLISRTISEAIGQAALVRRPILGADRLTISTLFFQEPMDHRHFHLDYGVSEKTKIFDYPYSARPVADHL